MRRHLTLTEAEEALGRGKHVEQFLGGFRRGDEWIIRYLVIRPEKGAFEVTCYEKRDEGHFVGTNIYFFTSAADDPDDDPEDFPFSSFEEAVAFAQQSFGAKTDKFVNQGAGAEEYKDYFASRGQTHDAASPISVQDAPIVKAKITQKKPVGRKQSFEISQDHYLCVSVSSPFTNESWSIPLHFIDPMPSRIRNVDLRPLVLVIPFCLLSLTCLYWVFVAFLFDPTLSKVVLIFLTGFFGALSAVPAWVMYLKSVNILLFRDSTGARLPLWFNNPSPEEFTQFVDFFKTAILAAQLSHPEVASLSTEIQKLKDLFDRGLLDKDQFESAKNKVTDNQHPTRTRF